MVQFIKILDNIMSFYYQNVIGLRSIDDGLTILLNSLDNDFMPLSEDILNTDVSH